MDIAKAVRTGKVKPAYITDKEKGLLLKRDKTKGSITEKFHRGIPVLAPDGLFGPDDPGGSGGHVSDRGSADYSGIAGYEDGTGGDEYGDEYADEMKWVGGKEGGYVSSGMAGGGPDSGSGKIGHPGMREDATWVGGAEGPDLPTDFPVDSGPDSPDPHAGKDTDPGSDAGGGDAARDIDDKEPVTSETPHTPESCAAAGGVWNPVTRSCEVRDVKITDPSPSSSLDTGYGADEPIEKAPRYKYREPTVKPTPGISETERVRAKVDAGTPLSVSVRDHLFGEATGVGSKYKRLAEMDEDREFREKQLAQAQAFAAKGMSFSTAQLDAETDMIREAAKRRLITADEAAKLQAELQMNALKTAEPIELLAAAGKIGDAGYGGSFTPGAIDTSRFMDPERFGLVKPPGFSGLPAEVGETSEESGPPKDGITDGKFTDSTGTVCNVDSAFENADGTWSCPKSTTPPGGGGGEK